MAEPGVMEKLGLDEEEWGEIVSLFIETTISDLDNLGRAIRKGDPTLAVQSSHSIKGAAANLGFDEISSLAAEVEVQARRGVLRGAEKRAERIKQNLDGLKDIETQK
jgi:histidine phosphotransfer protein HptB